MSWLDTIKGWFDKDSTKLIVKRLDSTHVDRQLSDAHTEVGKHYFRLRLTEMFLRKEVQAGSTWYPAVHSHVRCQFGNQVVDIPNVADATRVGMQQNAQGHVIARNFMLTPTLPFNGDVVILDAGLLSLQGANHLNKFIGVLSNFANLLAVPQFSLVLNIAQPLANGLQDLFSAGTSSMHLGFHDAYSAEELKPGYIAVIKAPHNTVDLNALWVVSDELCKGTGLDARQHAPFEDFDHMLFRIEVFENRDDWEKLTSIDGPRQEAIKALGDNDLDKARYHIQRARIQALLIPELTKADRRRVIDALNTEFEQNKESLGAAGLMGDTIPTLNQIMRRAISASQALQLGEPTIDDILL